MQITKRSLEKLLDHKKKLYFSRGGKFQILYFSDLHSHYQKMDPRTYEAMEKMIDKKIAVRMADRAFLIREQLASKQIFEQWRDYLFED